MGKRACLEELDQSCMYQFIARLASDIAADKLTVHTDAFGRPLFLPSGNKGLNISSSILVVTRL